LTCEDVSESARFLDVMLGIDAHDDNIDMLMYSKLAADTVAIEGILVEEYKFEIPKVVKRMGRLAF
jgi:hypothetical protein